MDRIAVLIPCYNEARTVAKVVAVGLLGWNSLLWKVLSNGVVTVTNYAVSRFRIFTEK